jgi:glycosyltransferase involved in cell wall biosynthesis
VLRSGIPEPAAAAACDGATASAPRDGAMGDAPVTAVDRTRLIVVGPTPPAVHGVSVMTVSLLGALRSCDRLAAHLDTRDPRPIETIGRFDLHNVRLALLHAFSFARLLARHRDAAVYVPISQNRLGFLRDATLLALARFTRRRRIVHLHGGYFRSFYRGARPPFRALVRFCLRGSEQAWVLTEGLRPELEDVVPADRVRVLENAVEDAGASPPRPAHDTGGDRFRLLYLANLVPEKGCFELVESLERLGPDARGLSVVFAGDASREVARQIEERARAIESAGAEVELVGTLGGERKRSAYLSADLFVYPTRYLYEGQPLVVLEAMSTGLPILSTRHRGIPDTVRDGEEAVLVAPGDPDALAGAIRRLRADPALRARLAAAARARYEERYRPERFERDVARLLGELDAPR